jgi:Ca2+-binding EF-hand superfamily protein
LNLQRICGVNHSVERLFDVLLYKLNKIGITGILSLSAEFRKADVDRNFLVTEEEFSKILGTLNIDFVQDDVSSMFKYLQVPQKPDFMDYSLLIKDLTSGMSNYRRDVTRSSFDRFDYNGANSFDIRILKSIFNSRNHFDVKNGRINSDDAINQFFKAVDLFVAIQRGNALVNSEQFLEFWEHISPSVDSDSYFESFFRNCFRFNELPRKNKLDYPENTNNLTQTPIYDKERVHPTDSIKYTMFPGCDSHVNENFIFKYCHM